MFSKDLFKIFEQIFNLKSFISVFLNTIFIGFLINYFLDIYCFSHTYLISVRIRTRAMKFLKINSTRTRIRTKQFFNIKKLRSLVFRPDDSSVNLSFLLKKTIHYTCTTRGSSDV